MLPGNLQAVAFEQTNYTRFCTHCRCYTVGDLIRNKKLGNSEEQGQFLSVGRQLTERLRLHAMTAPNNRQTANSLQNSTAKSAHTLQETAHCKFFRM